MTDLVPSPLVAVLAQSLLHDDITKGFVVEKLAGMEEVREASSSDADEEASRSDADEKASTSDPKDDGDLKCRISSCIDQLLPKTDTVPLGFQLDTWGRLKPKPVENAEEQPAVKRAQGQQQPDTARLERAIKKHLLPAAATVLASPELPFEFVLLVGYLGHGAIDRTYRLYADPTLDDFTSLREDDIVLRHRFHTENAPFDEVDVVWVKRIATVGRDRRQPRRAMDAAKFLEGELMDAAEAGSGLPTRIAGAASDEPFCVSYTCCKRTSVCRPGRG